VGVCIENSSPLNIVAARLLPTRSASCSRRDDMDTGFGLVCCVFKPVRNVCYASRNVSNASKMASNSFRSVSYTPVGARGVPLESDFLVSNQLQMSLMHLPLPFIILWELRGASGFCPYVSRTGVSQTLIPRTIHCKFSHCHVEQVCG
jgi:hypothetical protein